MSAPSSFAFAIEVSIPLTLLSTTAGSGDDSGDRQCSLFITEWIFNPVLVDASLISAASASAVMVCISTASKPASLPIANRSAYGLSRGSIEMSVDLRIVAGFGGDGDPPAAGAGFCCAPRPTGAKATAAVNVFRKSRLFSMGMLLKERPNTPDLLALL